MVNRTGTDGPDRLTGTAGVDSLDGLSGDDTLSGLGGSDRLFGRAGNDSLRGGEGYDDLYAGAGNDTLDGRATEYDEDTARYDSNEGSRGARVDFAAGTATDTFGNRDTLIDVERVLGSRFGDVLLGGAAANDAFEMFAGMRGADTIDGRRGFDQADYFFDVEFGGATRGIIANLAAGTIRDGFGTVDTVRNIEAVRGTDLADRMTGSSRDEVFRGRAGFDTIDGGAGRDAVEYRFDDDFDGPKRGVLIDLANGRAVDGFRNVDTLRNIENAEGTVYGDTIRGDAIYNYVNGEGGADSISGGNGDDLLYGDRENDTGAAGADTINGGNGNDRIDGAGGRDDLTGGAGRDQFMLSFGGDIIRDFEEGVDKLAGRRSVVPANWDFVAGRDPDAVVAGRVTVLYDTDSGRIFYDADGRGGDAAAHLATLIGRPDLSEDDFVLV